MLPREASRQRRTPLIALRPLALSLAAALALSAGACGDEDDGGSGGGTGYSGGGAVSAETAVTVTLDPDGPDGKEQEMTEEIFCEEGTEDEACVPLAAIDPADLEPPSPDVACTELYGGPDTATIEGEINGEAVDVELTRSNGCEIERFDAAAPLLEALFPGYEPGSSLDA